MLKKPLLAVLGAFFLLAFLVACGSKTDANESNFREALNQHFAAEKNRLCFWLRKMPMDIRESERSSNRQGAGLDALAAAGLLKSEEVEVSGRFGGQEKATRYTLTDAAQPFLRTDGYSPGLCWGKKRVGKIIKWIDHGEGDAGVIYTYDIVDMADWAKNQDVQEGFRLKDIVADAETKKEVGIGVRLTNIGWEVGE